MHHEKHDTRHRTRRCAILLLTAALAGCSGDDGSNAPQASATTVTPAQLCVAADCGRKETLLRIPDAENIHFTPDGRLFVSGANVFEVRRTDSTWSARALLADNGNFTGLAQIGDTLYAASFDGGLYAADLRSAEPVLALIHDTGFGSANGLADGPDGELYLVNSSLSGTLLPPLAPQIARLRLAPGKPMQVAEQTTWLGSGLLMPNGIQRRGSTLYFTDSRLLPPALGLLRSVEILADGSAGKVSDIGSLPSVPDDFALVGDHFLMALYSGNAVALMAPDGRIVSQTGPGSFLGASSVETGRPPLFAPTDIVVTEKGLIGDTFSPIGNVLSVYRRRE